MKKTYFLLFATCLLFMAFQCEDDSYLTMEEEEKALIASKKVIEDLAATSVCNENTECKYIAFGSKPCGGPLSYLIYSTSIDVNTLEQLVEKYNQKQADFNTKYGIFSDCTIINPPSNLICENNSCIAVY